MAYEPIEPTLVTTLPDTPEGEARGLVLSAELLQLAQQAGDFIYLFSYARNPNAPVDPTKTQFVKSTEIIHATTGEQILAGTVRPAPFVALYDPIGIGTPPELTPEVQLVRDSIDACKVLQPLVAIETAGDPLHDRLAALLAGGG